MAIAYTLNVGVPFNAIPRNISAPAGTVMVSLTITRPAGFSKKDMVQLVENILADYITQPDVANQALA